MQNLLVLHHYYHPDDVVGAAQFTGLCEGLAQKDFAEPVNGAVDTSNPQARHTQDLPFGLRASGQWDLEVWPANRACHNPALSYPTKPETLNSAPSPLMGQSQAPAPGSAHPNHAPRLEGLGAGVLVHRVWRPAFRQHSFLGRVLNSIWMQTAWFLRLLFTPSLKPDIILTGTDPFFSILLSPFLKLIRPKAKIAHWCFDLYPEAAIADGIVKENGLLVPVIRWFLKQAYKFCDLTADLGSCMRQKLERYGVKNSETLTPWALEEPGAPLEIDPLERKEVFGEEVGSQKLGIKGSKICLLYSGSFGRAHDYALTLKLARLIRQNGLIAYSARGSRLEELEKAVTPEDTNIRFLPFAPQDRLSARLSAPDIHIVSLRPEWTGIVVPSKFFGILAVGRPVLFEGSPDSAIAKWIEEYKVGWVLTPDNLEKIAADLVAFSNDPKAKEKMFRHCHEIYQTRFSKAAIVEEWNRQLRLLLS